MDSTVERFCIGTSISNVELSKLILHCLAAAALNLMPSVKLTIFMVLSTKCLEISRPHKNLVIFFKIEDF